jgi:predicted negative regulator of RcsB-dependent stress response
VKINYVSLLVGVALGVGAYYGYQWYMKSKKTI